LTKYTVQFDDSQKVVSVTYNYVWEEIEVEANSEEELQQCQKSIQSRRLKIDSMHSLQTL
jgi:hypothetical protein